MNPTGAGIRLSPFLSILILKQITVLIFIIQNSRQLNLNTIPVNTSTR